MNDPTTDDWQVVCQNTETTATSHERMLIMNVPGSSLRSLWRKTAICGLLLLFSSHLLTGAFFFGPKRRHRPGDVGTRVVTRLRAGDSNSGDDGPQKVLILMDGFCPYHCGYMRAAATEDFEHVAVLPVLSHYLADYLLATEPEESERWQAMRIPLDNEEKLNRLVEALQKAQAVAVYCESDSGLADAESLRESLSAKGVTNLLCDEPIQLEARRNKYVMQEHVRERAGLSVVRQKLCKSLSEAQEFAGELLVSGDHVIVKPFRGVASESVALCSTPEEVEGAWDSITATCIFGSPKRHDTVLVQEYLKGVEYALDIVSCQGRHKVAAVWRYDKRPANGAAFCYFQTRLVDKSMDPMVAAVCDYINKALTGLGIQYGMSHNEVIVTQDRGPVLVEVNCRQHNMDFAPLTMACIGYNALDMMLEAFFNSEGWEAYPELPTLRAHGCMVHLVNYASGHLVQVHHLDDMSALESAMSGEVYDDFQTPGSLLTPTTDIRSDAGWVQLVNEDPKTLQKDYERIVDWMPTMFQATEP